MKFRNYENGDQRYLNHDEMSQLKVGDLILRNRKGFAKILQFFTDEKGNELMEIKFLQTGEVNTFNRFESKQALVRFSFNHNLDNEFYEPINLNDIPPIQDNDLTILENKLNFKLPEHYKNFLLNFPNEINFFNRSRINRKERIFDLELSNDPENILRLNDYFDEFEQHDFFAIGEDGLGDYYCISKNEDDKRVYITNHESDRNSGISEFKDSIDSFVKYLLMNMMEESYKMLNR